MCPRFLMKDRFVPLTARPLRLGRRTLPTMRQHLIIDADDTLWENNIYFERAFDEFVEFLAHSTLTPTDVRAVLERDRTRRMRGFTATAHRASAATCGNATSGWRSGRSVRMIWSR